jgi:hypothetical protein
MWGVVSLTPWPVSPRGKSIWQALIRGWVCPRAGLDALEKRQAFFPCWESTHNCPDSQTYLSRYTDRAIAEHDHDRHSPSPSEE